MKIAGEMPEIFDIQLRVVTSEGPVMAPPTLTQEVKCIAKFSPVAPLNKYHALYKTLCSHNDSCAILHARAHVLKIVYFFFHISAIQRLEYCLYFTRLSMFN